MSDTPRHPAELLPPDYLEWLDALPIEALVTYRTDVWYPYTRDQMIEPMRLDKRRTTQARQLEAFVAMFREKAESAARGPKRSRFEFDRLEKCLVIGSYDSLLLFVDPRERFSVWSFEAADESGGVVKSVCDSLQTFIAKAKVEDLGEDDDADAE
jgi:hypothetical protein